MSKNRCYPNLDDILILGKFWLNNYIPAMQVHDECITVAKEHRDRVRADLLVEVAEWFKEAHVPARYSSSLTVRHLVERYIGAN